MLNRGNAWMFLMLLATACTSAGGGGGGGTTHTVSVTLTGLRNSYNGLTLRNNGGDDLRIFGDSSFTFKTPLASGAAYDVTVSSQPTGPDQVCTVTGGTGTIGSVDVTGVAVDCPYPTAYAVGGTVSGLTGSGLTLQYNADNVSLPSIIQMNADGPFVFDAIRTSAVNGTVYGVSISNQPTNPAQTCVVTRGSGTVASADVGDVSVSCAAHKVGVTVSGLRLHNGYGMTLQNNGGDDLTVFYGSASFATPLPAGSAYHVTISRQPRSPDQTCSVSHGTGTMGGSDVTDVLVDCPYPPAYAVGGTISGLLGSGLGLNYVGQNLVIGLGVATMTSTSFVYPAIDTSAVAGTGFTIQVWDQPTNPDQTCYFTGPGAVAGTSFVSGTVGNADVTDLQLTCGAVGSVLPCAAPSGAGTTHGSVTSAQTWTEAGSPHIVPFDIGISAPLTLQECAVVRIVKGGTVTINPGGSLTALGGTGRPVTIEAQVAGQAWSTIRNLGGTLSLTHTRLYDGGDPLTVAPAYTGAIRMQSNAATASLHLDDVEIADSRSQGVYVAGSVGFDATSRDLRIHGSASFPLHVYARVLGSIPTGTYNGNGRDEVAIAGAGGPVIDAQTMHDRGVPYHVGSGADGGRMDVNSQVNGQVAVLTIEPGVTIRFPPGGTLNVDPASGTGPAHGALVAIGTPSRRIVFTSDQATPKAGDWLGIGFGNAIDPASRLQNVRVEYAGGASVTGSNSCPYPGRVGPNDAAIRIFGPPATQFITDTEIISSMRDGIDRGWRADLQPDFLGSNTFTAVAGCKETTPSNAAGGCPPAPLCP